jgi:cation:H+ antiporter
VDLFTFVGLVGGLILLVGGAEVLVRGAGSIAKGFGVSSLIIGLTVVAYGTSAPEMAVSVAGAAGGEPGVALGNVVGSTIANILLILGISAVIGSLAVARRLVRIEVPIMIAIAVGVFLMATNGVIGRVEGIVLVIAAIAYTAYTILGAKKNPDEAPPPQEEAPKERGKLASAGFILVGLVGLVAGSQLLVDSATEIATALGLSDVIIGLTVVAVGTSLPEVATSIAAAIKGDRDLAVGNAIGSNIFNLSIVLGLSSVVAPVGLPVPQSLLNFDFPVMIAACVACLPIFFTRYCVNRWEGAAFLGFYVAYVTYLVLDATGHSRAETFGDAMAFFVLPITGLTIVVALVREFYRRKEAHASQPGRGDTSNVRVDCSSTS